jgi:hypothetical protein
VVAIISTQVVKIAEKTLIVDGVRSNIVKSTIKQEPLKARSGSVRRREVARIPTTIADPDPGSHASR